MRRSGRLSASAGRAGRRSCCAADVEGLPPSAAEGAVDWGSGAGGDVSGRVISSSKARRASTGDRRGRGDGVRGHGLGSRARFASRNDGGRGGRGARSGDLDVTRHSRAGFRGGVRQPIARADASTLLCTCVVSRTRRAAARAPGAPTRSRARGRAASVPVAKQHSARPRTRRSLPGTTCRSSRRPRTSRGCSLGARRRRRAAAAAVVVVAAVAALACPSSRPTR